jgi:hypothetical protein
LGEFFRSLHEVFTGLHKVFTRLLYMFYGCVKTVKTVKTLSVGRETNYLPDSWWLVGAKRRSSPFTVFTPLP